MGMVVGIGIGVGAVVGLVSLSRGFEKELNDLLTRLRGDVIIKQKDRVTRGGLIGMIKYGSRTEIIIPLEAGFQPSVAVKDKVCGGVTILGRFEKAGEGKTED